MKKIINDEAVNKFGISFSEEKRAKQPRGDGWVVLSWDWGFAHI